MSSESPLVAAATSAYRDAQPSSGPVDAREHAARRFRAAVAELDERHEALPSFMAALRDDDAYRREAAARALVESRWPEAAESVLEAYATQGPQIDAKVLRKLGRRAPLPDAAWDLLERVRPFEQAALVEALLTWPTPTAERRWHALVAGNFDAYLIERGVVAVDGWKRPELLRSLLVQPRRAVPASMQSLPADLKPGDFRLQAAFCLALRGDHEAIEFLVCEADSPDARHAVDASVHLAALGLPVAVALVARHLRGRSNYVVEMAMDAAVCLCTPALGPALCAVAEQARARGVPSIPDEALRALAVITGRHSAPQMGDDGSTTPHAERKRAAIVQRTALAELDPALRYHHGQPLTLLHLVDDLTSVHKGPMSNAAYSLRALTGDEFGFDPDDDLIGNLDAIEAWRARAAQSSAVGAGEWAFHGKKLQPPPAPT